MQLSTYIKDLLYRYECVIIPGFGAFLANYTTASIDTESHTFYPPGKSISFNRQLQTNDGLLANYVASVEGTSYEKALEKIRSFTGKLSLQLMEGSIATLDGIGDFKLNPENSVAFTPSNAENFNTAAFGLTTFVSSEISRLQATGTSTTTVEEPFLFAPTKRSQPYLKYAAVGLIALALAGFVGMKMYEGNIEQHNFAEKQKATTVLEKQIQEATFVIDNPLPAIELALTKQTGSYHIVAGAFRMEENAATKIEQLQEKGFSATMIGVNKYGLHQVVYSSHTERLDALNALRTIKREENKDAWLLVKKLEE
ncbi:SPOR domain-containing protein [Patiriisocius marinus]|uniref:HU domain-containing protein n=1 Tax=Patiriisocius marinus TaxID=1397112 RepID=UPI00232DBCE9|nr:SPOR domain-containing protein [Patiriisocius marinus]